MSPSGRTKPDPDLTYDLTQNDERSDDLTLVVVWITVAPILKPPTPSRDIGGDILDRPLTGPQLRHQRELAVGVAEDTGQRHRLQPAQRQRRLA